MPEKSHNLGICFSGQRMYYAVASTGHRNLLDHIGCIDFSFPVLPAIIGEVQARVPVVRESVENLRQRYGVRQVCILTPPEHECWTTLPRAVYENPNEREANLQILMKGEARRNLEPTWFTISNRDYKLLAVRDKRSLSGFRNLTGLFPQTDFSHDFEIGARWITHTGTTESLLTLSCYDGILSVSSFLLGKLRAATYFRFEDPQDLPYLWQHYAWHLPWMNGLYDRVLMYGVQPERIFESLQPVWDGHHHVEYMDSLSRMQVDAREHTYGFHLYEAFPAIMLALDH